LAGLDQLAVPLPHERVHGPDLLRRPGGLALDGLAGDQVVVLLRAVQHDHVLHGFLLLSMPFTGDVAAARPVRTGSPEILPSELRWWHAGAHSRASRGHGGRGTAARRRGAPPHAADPPRPRRRAHRDDGDAGGGAVARGDARRPGQRAAVAGVPAAPGPARRPAGVGGRRLPARRRPRRGGRPPVRTPRRRGTASPGRRAGGGGAAAAGGGVRAVAGRPAGRGAGTGPAAAGGTAAGGP